MSSKILIQRLTNTQVPSVAELHIDGISEGFISSLGLDFVTALYETICEDSNSFCLIAKEDDKTIGFVAFTENLSKLFKSAVKSRGMKLVLAVGLRVFRPSVFKRVIQNVFYPSKTEKLNLPKAELLSIVVNPAARGKGIAKQLCQAGLKECRKRGIDKVKILVATNNEPANRLYLKCGFQLVITIDSHGVPSNIYVAEVRS